MMILGTKDPGLPHVRLPYPEENTLLLTFFARATQRIRLTPTRSQSLDSNSSSSDNINSSSKAGNKGSYCNINVDDCAYLDAKMRSRMVHSKNGLSTTS